MKKLHLTLLFSLAVLIATSQKVYFVYIQTETEQAFFVKMNEKVNSSTASGYIILPKLFDSIYSFSIGFPQNKWPEQNFSVLINKKDHGYLLKNFGEKGWGLFDLQTLNVQMAITGKTSINEKTKVENNDVSVFTEILSRAADDPSLKEKPVQPKLEEKRTEVTILEVEKKEEPKVDVKEPVVIKLIEVVEIPVVKTQDAKVEKEPTAIIPKEIIEQSVLKKEDSKTEIKEPVPNNPIEIIEQPVVKKEEIKVDIKEQPALEAEELVERITELYKTSQVRKWSESSTTEGFGLVFTDDYGNGTRDTIRLLIPNPKPVVNMVKEQPKDEKKFLDISIETPKKEEEKKAVISEKMVEQAIQKNNCIEIASGSDFFKLRKKMAAAEKDDDMISEAKKYFKTKCFTSTQLKNLSTLFLNDEGKYKFFDASYKYVSDTEAFGSLQDEMKDEYYTSRFKAMLRN